MSIAMTLGSCHMRLILFMNKMPKWAVVIVFLAVLCWPCGVKAEDALVVAEDVVLSSSEVVEKVNRKRFKLMGPAGVRSSARFEFHNILFKLDSAELVPNSRRQLDEIVAALVKLGQATSCAIEGHTDDLGEADYNVRLSNERAEAVRSYIRERLSLELAIEVKGFGETSPLCAEKTDVCRKMNRRVEVVIN